MQTGTQRKSKTNLSCSPALSSSLNRTPPRRSDDEQEEVPGNSAQGELHPSIAPLALLILLSYLRINQSISPAGQLESEFYFSDENRHPSS
jgi:hypothetical protein